VARSNEQIRTEELGNEPPREMAATPTGVQNPAYRRAPATTKRLANVIPINDGECPVMANFTKEMTVEQAFRAHAGARRVFAKFHLGGCSHCAISEHETIEQVSEGYGIPLAMLMEELDKLFSQPVLTVGDAVRLPGEIRTKIPQLANVPETGQITKHEAGAYTAEFGEVRLQGLAEDFIKVEPAAATA